MLEVWGQTVWGAARRAWRYVRVGKRGRQLRRALPTALKKQPGTLILVRHGESQWNENSTFTGWCDPGLSARGEREVRGWVATNVGSSAVWRPSVWSDPLDGSQPTCALHCAWSP